MEDGELQLLVEKFFVDDSCFSIPLEEFTKHTKDFRIVKLDAMVILSILNEVTNVDWKYDLRFKTILFYPEHGDNISTFTIQIPCDDRHKYIDSIVQIIGLVPKVDSVLLYVSNNTCSPESYIVVETRYNSKKIEDIIAESGLKIVDEKSSLEWDVLATSVKSWRRFPLPYGDDIFFLREVFNSCYTV